MIRKIKFSNDNLYLFAYAICSILSLIGSSAIWDVNNNIKLILYSFSIIIFSYLIIKSGLSLKKIFFIICLSILSLYTYYKIGSIFFLIDTFALFAIKDRNIKKIVVLDLIIKIIFLLSHTILYGLDYLFDYEALKDNIFIRDDMTIRHSMYFVHPNIFSSLMLWGIVDIYIIKEKISILDFILATLIIILSFIITDTRTLIILYFIFIILSLLKKQKKLSSFINSLTACLSTISIRVIAPIGIPAFSADSDMILASILFVS